MPDNAKKNYKAGETILRQGEPGEAAYIIESGHVQISIAGPDGQIQNVGTRGPGSMIGEMALVDRAPRTATVSALENCALLEITNEDFSRRLQDTDPILRLTTQVILTRYRDMLARATIMRDRSHWPPVEALELKHAHSAHALESVKMTNEFRAAIGGPQITLHYQPIIALQTGRVAGFEALMRWNHPVSGPVSPAVFIPLAEQSGDIVAASKWALRESCLALKRVGGSTGHEDDLFMSVNFSSRDFAAEGFVDAMYDIISKTDLPVRCVHLEITERLLMDQPENARETLEMCSKAGMGVAIDDFGTGFSSLSYLHNFPIDTLKIDRSFVRDMTKKESSVQLIKSIIALGKNMKMNVVAEGVEQEEEARMLKSMGCDMAQGYFFSRPMPEAGVIEYLRKFEPYVL